MTAPSMISSPELAAVLVAQQRPQRASALSASLTFGWRAVLRIKHVPEQLGDVLGIPIIFTLMFTYLFGGALAGSTGDYVQFLLPGSLVMAILMVSMYAGVGLSGDISSGVTDRFRSLPIWRPAPIVGGLIGDAGRYAIASVLVIGLGLAMGYRPAGGVIGVVAGVALVLVFAFGLGWAWAAIGLTMRTPSAVMNVGMLVLFPLSFASNVFVRPETMPGWLEAAVDANPVTHLVTAVRGLMAGSASGVEIGWALASTAVLVAVFAPLTMAIYGRRS